MSDEQDNEIVKHGSGRAAGRFGFSGARTRLVLRIALITMVAAFCGIIVMYIPISPGSDSFTLVNSLKYLQNGSGYTEWSMSYYNFWGNNKIALLIYYFFTRMFSMTDTATAVEYGIRLTHFFTLCMFVFSMALAFHKLFGKRFFTLTLLLSVLLYPYLILTAPYVYPIAVSVAALCFCAGTYRSIASYIVFFLSFGLLFMLRPTAAIFIVAYHITALIRSIAGKDGSVKRCAFILIIMALSIPAVKQTAGFAMYKTGLHPYPGFANSATLWTLYVGTNFAGEDTGVVVYEVDLTPEPGADRLAVLFHQLWIMSSADGICDIAEMKTVQKEIRTLLLRRVRETILDSPLHLFPFLRQKAANLFVGEVPPVFYQLNVTSDCFTSDAAENIQDDGYRYKNIIGIMTLLSLLMLHYLRKRQAEALWTAIPVAIGALGTVAVFIAATEVSSRYLTDILPALLVVIICGFAAVAGEIEKIDRVYMKDAYKGLVVMAAASIILITYKGNGIAFWKGAQSQMSITGGIATLSIQFSADPPEGYGISSDFDSVPLTKNTEIIFEPSVPLFLYTPDGGQYAATHDPINHERFLNE